MTSISIRIYSPLTGQQIEVAVKVKVFGDNVQCAPEPTWVNLFTSIWQFIQERAIGMLTLLGTCAAIYLGINSRVPMLLNVMKLIFFLYYRL